MQGKRALISGLVVGVAALAAGSVILARPLPVTEVPHAALPACGAQKDFLVRSDPMLAPVRPADCSLVTQSPPEFIWPAQDGNDTYTVILHFSDGTTKSRTTTGNWINWDEALPAGEYTWQVKSTLAHETSSPRKFTIARDAVSFLLPGDDVELDRARKTAHPRSWPTDATSPLRAVRAERAEGFAKLLDDVDGKLGLPVEDEPTSKSKNSNYDATVNEQKRTLNAAFAYAGTRERKYGDDAVRRLLAQARWSTTGPIALRNNDMASRNVAWTLALGYDWLYDRLTASQKATILAAIRERTRDMYDEYIATREITRNPYDSHGNLTLTITAAIASLVAGDIPEADQWLRGSVTMAAVWTSPWGGSDGGFANGTTQAQWDTGSNLLAWYVLRNAVGVDLGKKEWVRNYSRYLAYFLPPGAPAGLFGDGQEEDMHEVWARVGKAYTNFAPSPLGRWYAAQFSGEDSSRLELLLAPRAEKSAAAYPSDAPNAAFFPSIGWVAMHSNLADPARTSVYFKSSPYGSYNHSHADQNSFVIDYRGERLAIKSGYYDDYRTPHWKDWYKQTRSANAITFDGGQGQGVDGKQYSGEVTRFEAGDGLVYAVGHAEKAYDGKLTRAQRTMVTLGPNVVLVYDNVASPTPRTWEWNIHALKRMNAFSDRKVSITSGKAQMCVEMLAGPEVTFAQTSKFTVAPGASTMNPKTPDQWHGTFATTGKSDNAEFVALMRIGSDCPTTTLPTASAKKTAQGWEVAVDGKTVKVSGDRVSAS
jgi:hypothetical protein